MNSIQKMFLMTAAAATMTGCSVGVEISSKDIDVADSAAAERWLAKDCIVEVPANRRKKQDQDKRHVYINFCHSVKVVETYKPSLNHGEHLLVMPLTLLRGEEREEAQKELEWADSVRRSRQTLTPGR